MWRRLCLLTFFSTAAVADSPMDLFRLIQNKIQQENQAAGKDTVQSFQGSAAQQLQDAQKEEQKTQDNIDQQERQEDAKILRELHPQSAQEEEEDEAEARENIDPHINVENDSSENQQVQTPVDPDLSRGSPLNEDLSQ